MNKLPFVWELKHDDNTSHAIGSPKGLPTLSPENYTKDIVNYLDGKTVVFVESFIPREGTLDKVIVDIARAMELFLKRNPTEDERKSVSFDYSFRINNVESTESYKKGDETELKRLYGELTPAIDAVNRNIVVRSIRNVKTVPTLLVANLAHFLVEPSLLNAYEEKGIKIKRIQ